jgi:hypothetical protein
MAVFQSFREHLREVLGHPPPPLDRLPLHGLGRPRGHQRLRSARTIPAIPAQLCVVK